MNEEFSKSVSDVSKEKVETRESVAVWEKLTALFVMVALIVILLLIPLAWYGVVPSFEIWADIEILVVSFVLADLAMDAFLTKWKGVTVSRIMLWAMRRKKADTGWNPTHAHAFVGYFVGIFAGGAVGVAIELVWLRYEGVLPFVLLTVFSFFFLWWGFKRLISGDRTHIIPRPNKNNDTGNRTAGDVEGVGRVA